MISLGELSIKPFISISRKAKGHVKTLKPACSASTSADEVAVLSHKPFLSEQPGRNTSDLNPIIQRRSGNYQPPLWGFQDIHSHTSEYTGERFSLQVSELKDQVSNMFPVNAAPVDQLEFIDDLERLGISYHFEDKINKMLSRIYMDKYMKNNDDLEDRDMYTEALCFRVFRQHGFMVSQDAFDYFKDEKGYFKSDLTSDTKGLLQLYEASYTLEPGEGTLELAIEFTTRVLQQKVDSEQFLQDTVSLNTSSTIKNALELPFHWKAERANTKSYIQAYEGRSDMNPILLDFAKLDFNILQSTYQQELKDLLRWWEETGLIEKVPFARDRLVEAYFWSVGAFYEPEYGYYRKMMSKLIEFIAIFDDIYDVYGTMDELKLLTEVIQRWDRETYHDLLPEYLQAFWLELNNFIDESVDYVLKNQGSDITPYLRKTWRDYSEISLQEATWYHTGYKPTTDEYMKVAWYTVSGPVVLTHAFFLVANPIKEEVVQSLYKYHELVCSSSVIFRLLDDWGTSPDEMKRGDVPKWIECYMNETGKSEKEARERLISLLRETWKKMNRESRVAVRYDGFPAKFIRSATGLARVSRHVYYDGDGFGGHSAKDHISDLFFQPML